MPPTLSEGVAALTPDEESQLMTINRVEIGGLEHTPPQPSAAIEGIIGDSCNSLEDVAQGRDGNRIVVQISVRRQLKQACEETTQMFHDTVALQGEFPPGEYILAVNGTEVMFSVSPTPTPRPSATVPATPTVEPTLDPNCEADAEFVEDVTFPDGTPVGIGNPFVKTWRMENNGTCPWTSEFFLVQVEGDLILGESPTISLPLTMPGETADLSVTLRISTSSELGSTQRARFRLQAPGGEYFGDHPFVEVVASDATPVPTSTVEALACEPDSEFVLDVSVPDGAEMPTGEFFVKTWRIRNTGDCVWDGTFLLVQIEGEPDLLARDNQPIPLPVTQPGEEIDISVNLILSPDLPPGSSREARFKIRAPDGTLFGAQFFTIVKVPEASEN